MGAGRQLGFSAGGVVAVAKKRATKKKRTAKKAERVPGKLVNAFDDRGTRVEVYEHEQGVSVVKHFDGAKIMPEGPQADPEVVPRVVRKACTYCGGRNTEPLKTLRSTVSFRCRECVDPETGTLRTFYLPRERKEDA